MATMIMLTRYRNRRYYSRDLKAYINAPELVKLVKSGKDVKIVCHKTKLDITESILSNLLVYGRFNKNELVTLIKEKL